MSERFTDQRKLECIERELHYRKRVYQRRVDRKTMTPHHAALEIALMEEIADDYRKRAKKAELPL